MKDRLSLVNVVEVVINATIHNLQRKEPRSARRRGRDGATWDAMTERRSWSKLRLSLRLSQFREDFCPAAFGTFLLRNGVVSASQTGRNAVFAGFQALADAFHFTAVAAAGKLARLIHFGRGPIFR